MDDFRPLPRAISPDESAAVRRAVRERLRIGVPRMVKGVGVLALLFVGAWAIDWYAFGHGHDRLRWVLIGAAVLLGVVLLIQSRVLLALPGLDRRDVMLIEGIVDRSRGDQARIHTGESWRGGFGGSDFELYLTKGEYPVIHADTFYRFHVVRTAGGRYVVGAQTIRAATPQEIRALNKHTHRLDTSWGD